MTVLSRGARVRRGGRRPGWVLLTTLLVLAIGASSALVFTDRVELLKLAVILALWAAVAGAFVSVAYRRQADADQARARDMKLVYDLQLEREISARREYELTVESQLRRELASELRGAAADEVAALRAELTALRTSLEILFDADLQEHPALQNVAQNGAQPGERLSADWVASDRVRVIRRDDAVSRNPAQTGVLEAIVSMLNDMGIRQLINGPIPITPDGEPIIGRAPGATDPTSSGFSQMLPIILAVPDQLRRPAFRKNDLSLLNYRNQAKPTLRLALGPITDIVSGGTAPTCSGNVDLVIEYEPNPQPGKYNPVTPAASGDEPGLQVDCQVALISSLGSQPEAPLPTGQGRTLLAMLIREEQPSTSPVTEVSNIFTANTSAFTLKYGSDNIVDGVPLTTLDQIMQHKENVSLTAGTHLYIPAEDGKTADGVNVRDGRDLRAKFTAIANSADRELQLLCFFGRDVEEGATFAAQAKASQSQ